jgi:glycosyltransferase involved in cell wall biosynthesis
MILYKFDAVLIFAGHGMGFIEKGLMVIIGRAFRTKVVLSPRSGFLLNQVRASNFMRHYVKFVMNRASILMCQGKTWANNYQKLTNAPEAKFKVIPNWIKADTYLNLPKNNCSNDKTIILFMGWIEQEKGIFDLTLAITKNREAFKNSHFILAGSGSQINRIKNEVITKGIDHLFEFPGWVKGQRKLELLAKADIFVLPSHAEGMPNALLESMASRCAVIASNVGAIPEVIENHVNGILISPGDINALGESLISVANNKRLREELATAAKQSIADNHNISNIWMRVNELL